MKFSQFFSGQRIIKQLLDWFNQARTESTAERVSDIYSDGVLVGVLNSLNIIGKDLDPTLTDFFHIKVDTGVAYKNGERILIDNAGVTFNASNPSTTTNDGLGNFVLTPHSTGSFDIPLTAGSINYVYITYLQTTDETVFTLHKLTNAKQFYKRTDGYAITTNITGINPDSSQYILLGQIDLTGLNQAVSSNISVMDRPKFALGLARVLIETPNVGLTDRTTSYLVGNNQYYVEQHTKAVGSGTISATNPHGLAPVDIGALDAGLVDRHIQYQHSSGIIGDALSVTSSLFAIITAIEPGFDTLTIKGLTANEIADVNGTIITSTNLGSDTILTWTGSDLTGTYYVYLDQPTKTVQRTSVNLVATPDPSKLLLWSVVWTYPGDLGAGDGDLSNLVDFRRFGSINSKDIQDDYTHFILSLVNGAYPTTVTSTYSPTAFNLLTSTVTGTDADGVTFSFDTGYTYSPNNDDPDAILTSSVQTATYGAVTRTTTSIYSYDGDNNLISVLTS